MWRLVRLAASGRRVRSAPSKLRICSLRSLAAHRSALPRPPKPLAKIGHRQAGYNARQCGAAGLDGGSDVRQFIRRDGLTPSGVHHEQRNAVERGECRPSSRAQGLRCLCYRWAGGIFVDGAFPGRPLSRRVPHSAPLRMLIVRPLIALSLLRSAPSLRSR